MTYTRGPWEVLNIQSSSTGGSVNVMAKTAHLGYVVVATVPTPHNDQMTEYGGARDANARLIAAAPQMADALTGLSGLLADVESEPECDPEILRAIYAAREAIAKAGVRA